MGPNRTLDQLWTEESAKAQRVILVDDDGEVIPIGEGVLPSTVFVVNTDADPIPVEISEPVDLSAATLAALETITAIINTLPDVNLSATTLAALESITAVVSGTVELGAATLAALETINAVVLSLPDVNLSATTLAALENINAVVSGTVTVNQGTSPWVVGDGGGSLTVDGTQLDALTDAELRAAPVEVEVTNFPAVQAVSATNLDIRDLVFATDKVDVSGSSVAVSNFPATQLTKELNQLVPVEFDYLSLGYTGEDITTVVYRTGGAGGTIVATLTLAYSVPGVLSSVTRS